MLLKDHVEQMMRTYTLDHPEVSFKSNKISTVIYQDGMMKMTIYYRSDAARFDVKIGTTQHGEYDALFREKLAYQRPTANPYSKSEYAFFVDPENILTVIERLLKSNTSPTQEQLDEYAAWLEQYNKTAKDSQTKKENLFVPLASQTGTIPEKSQGRVEASNEKGNQRIENKLDSIMSAIVSMHTDTKVVTKTVVETDKRFRVEKSKPGSPYLVVKDRALITGLIHSIKLFAIGSGDTTERYRVFFVNKDFEQISSVQEVDACAEKQYTCRFELNSSASEEKSTFLVVQGQGAASDEARQLIEIPISIEFSADFGF